MSEVGIGAGVYRGHVVANSEQYTETKGGDPQIILAVQFWPAENPDEVHEASVFMVFSDKSAPWKIKQLRACGWEGTQLSNLAGVETNEVDIGVKWEDYTNPATGVSKRTMRVEILSGLGGGKYVVDDAKKLQSSQLRSLDNKFASLTGNTNGQRAASGTGPKF